MSETIIALAQSASVKGDTNENIRTHLKMAKMAAEKGAQLIAFPELSLTGYEPELAASLAFKEEDERLFPLKELSVRHQLILIAGAPFRSETGLYIAAFIIYPDRSTAIYTKHYLHPGEEKYFTPGTLNPPILLGKEKIAVSVCADMANPQHAEDAAGAGCSIYLSAAFITPGGYATDSRILKGYAQKYSMPVMLANYSGTSGGFESAGRTAVWSAEGKLIGELEGDGEGLLICSKNEKNCSTRIYPL